MTGYTSGRTHSAGTLRTYCSPTATEYRTEARHSSPTFTTTSDSASRATVDSTADSAPLGGSRALRIGSLFSGYGGLDLGVQSVLGGTIAWHSEIDPGACKILAHRYPDVPNLGDITAVDWSAVEPVDVLTGGFPCQDVSLAGLRRGMRPDTRSGLWSQMAYAIDQLRPSLVVIENVRGLLSADAHGSLDPCPWCVGDDDGVPLRALGGVLGDLADLGYDASWHGLRAADVGAPHGRFRVFVVAWPAADADRLGHERNRRARHGWTRPADSAVASAHAEGHGRHEGRPEPAGQLRRSNAVVGGGTATTHPHGHVIRPPAVPLAGRNGTAVAGHPGADAPADADQCGRRPNLDELRAGQPDPDRRAATHAHGDGLGGREELHGVPQRGGQAVVERDDAHRLAVAARGVEWGPYEPAIRRWERRLGRPAPSPTERGKNGQPRLSPAFVEWMQGLPAGWVTAVPGLTRNEQLKALGNGVVPQQAAEALRILLPTLERAA